MPEVTITYKSQKTFKLLMELSKYLGFIISKPTATKTKSTKNTMAAPGIYIVNGVTLVRGNAQFDDIDKSEVAEILTKNNIEAAGLRTKWQRGL